MWTCPKCGREFKRTNQGHYCGKAPESIDEYLNAQISEAQAHIRELRTIIQHSAPGVRERIAWSMPVFEKDKRRISFAACKKHISLYLDEEVLARKQQQFNGYVIKKNTLYLPYDRKLPIKEIEDAVKDSLENNRMLL